MRSDRARIFVDARCLQDINFNFRGVGFHVASLLRARRNSDAAGWHAVALLDESMPVPPREYTDLFDSVSYSWNPVYNKEAIFISASPMTHDPALSIRFASSPKLLRTAVVYDFIPLDRPGYFPSLQHRIEYFAQLARLKHFDLYCPISRYSGMRLQEVLGVGAHQIAITGACVRDSLYRESRLSDRSNTNNGIPKPYVFTLGGGDRRKNTEVVVRAVRSLRDRGHDLQLRIVGHYADDYRRDLITAAGPGHADYLHLLSGVSDRELASLYSGALVTVAPSHIEGFSLPVVEAAVCKSPVIASSCAAHLELIQHRRALFASDSADELSDRILAVAENPSLRQELLGIQAPLASRFHEDSVGSRFWNAICSRWNRSACSPAVRTGAKPDLALLSPFPPDASGVARFTELTVRAAARYFNISVYTDANRPLRGTNEYFRDAGPIHYGLLRRPQHDAVVSVLGNSHFHLPMLDLVERFGGPCILHDSRLTQVYAWRLGRERFTQMAEKLLGRTVHSHEVDEWLSDRNVPSLFVEPVLKHASPLIVHTQQYQSLLRSMYNYEAELATFPPNLRFTEEELSFERRQEARHRLEIPDDVFAVVSLGYVQAAKGTGILFAALDLLRRWGIPARLYMAGSLEHQPGAPELAAQLGVAEHVRFHPEFLSAGEYRDYLLAADAAVQLRMYGFGQPSAGLSDCISAGLPAVANTELAEACDAPEYVARLPQPISPLHVAEGLAALAEKKGSRDATSAAREAFISTHTFDYYARRLGIILGFEPL